MRYVVRNFEAEKTHIADVQRWSTRAFMKKPYKQPDRATRALCGVHIKDGVIMQPGTEVLCSACRYLSGGETDAE